MSTSLGDKIRRNAFWLVGSSVVVRFFGFLVSIIMARLLVPADFGIVTTMAIFTGFAGLIAAGGMGDALVRSPSIEDIDYAIVFTAQLAICSVIYTFFYFISPYFAIWLNEPLYETLLKVSALSFLLRPFITVARAKLGRQQNFKSISLIQFATLLVSSTTSISLAMNGAGVWALVLGGLAGALFTIPLVNWAAGWYPRIRINLGRLKLLGTVGLQFTLNHVILHWNRQIGFLIISKMMGAGTLGLFSRSEGLSSMPRELIINASNRTLFRGFAEIQDNVDQSGYLLIRAITLFSAYTMPFYVGLWWLAEPFVLNVYGEKWLGVVEPLRILAFSGFLLIANPSGAIMAAQGYLSREIRINIELLIIMAVACLFGAKFGLVGVAVAFVGVRLYGSLRLYLGAARALNLGLTELISALTPAYCLNLILFFMLFAIESAAQMSGLNINGITYLLIASLLGAICYTICFVCIPFNGLANERTRWINIIRRVV